MQDLPQQTVLAPEIATPGMPDVLLVAVLLGVLIFGITEVLKLLPGDRWKDLKSKPTWWRVLVRVFPIGSGCGMGLWFYDFPWGLAIGGAAGVLCAVLYKRARKFVTDMKDTVITKEDEKDE